MIEKGEIEIINENCSPSLVIKTLKVFLPKTLHKPFTKAGELIGAFSFFSNFARESSIRSKGFSTLFEIKRSDFLSIVKTSPEDFEKFMMIREKMMIYSDYKETLLTCLGCRKPTHLLDKCPFLHFIPDSRFLINRSLYSVRQPRASDYIRGRVRKRFNALSDFQKVQNKALLLESLRMSGDSEDSGESVERSPPLRRSKTKTRTVYIENDKNLEEKNEEEPPLYPRFPEDQRLSKEENEDENAIRRQTNEGGSEGLRSEDEGRNFMGIPLGEKLPTGKKLPLLHRNPRDERDKLAFEGFFIPEFEKAYRFEAFFPEGNLSAVLKLMLSHRSINSPGSGSRASRRASRMKVLKVKKMKCARFFLKSNDEISNNNSEMAGLKSD